MGGLAEIERTPSDNVQGRHPITDRSRGAALADGQKDIPKIAPYRYKIAKNEKLAINCQIQHFVCKGIIVPTVREANIFSRPKPDGSVRIIQDILSSDSIRHDSARLLHVICKSKGCLLIG